MVLKTLSADRVMNYESFVSEKELNIYNNIN